ncbi:hypothetical protein SteCoe_32035 [Stentor coeruleus]|uniref:VHS domain-containing protein n=1 Tax=Stentor coeruleus TaxID=5963 RepID=A0A1R2AZZ0_9CILI|nr:hypothetical protein SteCoe_32035 [Stentor coeruleus]
MNYKPVDMVKFSIMSEEDYQRMAPLLADLTKNAKLGVCKDIISQIKKIIKSKSNPPPQKLRSLKLLNACMMVGNVNFLVFTQKKIMSRLGILAGYKKELALELRAESLFGKDSSSSIENRSASIDFINTLLEYIKLWAAEFGKAPDKSDSIFYTTYMKLKDAGVRFPTKQTQRISIVKEEKKAAPVKKASGLDAIENILKLYEENTDESLAQDYLQMLRAQKPHVESALQDAMNTSSSGEIEYLLSLMDKITSALDNTDQRIQKKSESKKSMNASPIKLQPTPASAYISQSSERSPGQQFDLFELDLAPQGSFERVSLPQNPKPSAFATHQPIILNPVEGGNNMFPTQTSNNMFPSQSSNNNMFPPPQVSSNNNMFPPSQTSNNMFPSSANMFPTQPVNRPSVGVNMFPQPKVQEKDSNDQTLAAIKLENSQLKEALDFAKSQLQERDILIQNLKKCNQEITSQIEALNEQLAKAQKKVSKCKDHKELLGEALEHIERLENELKQAQASKPVAVKKKEETKADLFFGIDSEPSSKDPEKRLEKKTTLDFDLDFILSPGPKKAPEPQSSVNYPNLFGSPSEIEAPTQITISQPTNDLPYRMGNCMEMGMLLDTESLQIGFRIQRQAFEIFCCIFIGNKLAEPITEIITELSDVAMEAMPMMMQPLKSTEEVATNGQATRMIKAQFIDVTSKIPKISIKIKWKTMQSTILKLPLTIARFIEARQELPTSIWMEWKKMVFEEDTCVINLAPFSNIVEMCTFLILGGAFRIYSTQELEDLSPTQILGAGQLSDSLVMFMVNVVQGGTQANFAIRCKNLTLRNAIAPIIKGQIISI